MFEYYHFSVRFRYDFVSFMGSLMGASFMFAGYKLAWPNAALRLQFSLRQFMIFVTAVALLLGTVVALRTP
jgi:hypothetical protein